MLTNIKTWYRYLSIYLTKKSLTKAPSEPSHSTKMKLSAKLSSGKKKQLFLNANNRILKKTVSEYMSLLTNPVIY